MQSDDGVWDAFDGRPHELRMGLRPLDMSQWTRPTSATELDRKADLLETRRGDVLAAVGATDAAARELDALLADHLTTYRADSYRREGAAVVFVADGRSWPDDMDPLERAGRMVSEDWCLVRPGEPPTLAAATLCSPNRWRLAEKLGRPITDIHDPVPGYRRRLGAPVDALFGTRRGPTWRRNWSIQSSPSRFQPFADGPEHPRVPDQVWIRSELETLVRLPVTGWWVFGIHTSVGALGDVTPAVAARMLTAVRSLDPETTAYKDLATFRQPLAEWLASRT